MGLLLTFTYLNPSSSVPRNCRQTWAAAESPYIKQIKPDFLLYMSQEGFLLFKQGGNMAIRIDWEMTYACLIVNQQKFLESSPGQWPHKISDTPFQNFCPATDGSGTGAHPIGHKATHKHRKPISVWESRSLLYRFHGASFVQEINTGHTSNKESLHVFHGPWELDPSLQKG